MKKKILSVVSVCSALVLSAGVFVACDENDKRPTPVEPEPIVLTPAQKLEKGVTLLAEKPALTGEISATLESDNENATSYKYTFTENGTAAKASDGTNEYFVNLDTGYSYRVAEGGAEYGQIVPAKLYGYAVEAVKSELPEKINSGELDKYLSEADGKVKISLDYKSDVNKYLDMLNRCYEGSLRDVLAELLAGTNTPEEFFDSIESMILMNVDRSATYMISIINTQLANLGLDATVKDIFIGAGVTEDEYAAVSRRKAGEMVAGALALKDTIADIIAGGDFENVDYAALLRTAFEAMFVTEIPQEKLDSLETDLAAVKSDILSALSSYKVKSLVDKLVESTGMTDIRTMAEEGVLFTRLDAQFTVSFDADGCISEVAYAAFVAHDYTVAAADGETGDPSVNGEKFSPLSDNNYSIVGKISVSEPETANIAIPENTLPIGEHTEVSAVAGKSGAEIYVECGANETPSIEITSVSLDGSDATFEPSVCTVVGKTVKIDKATVDGVRSKSGTACLRIVGTVNGKSLEAVVYVPADYTLESIFDIVKVAAQARVNGSAPSPDAPTNR